VNEVDMVEVHEIEQSREYIWICPITGNEVSAFIENPVAVTRDGDYDAVIDINGVITMVPGVGIYGCHLLVLPVESEDSDACGGEGGECQGLDTPYCADTPVDPWFHSCEFCGDPVDDGYPV
jgi:hypothetical protein